MKTFIKSRKFKVILTAGLILQTLLVLSVIDQLSYNSFNFNSRYGTNPVVAHDDDGNPLVVEVGPFKKYKLQYTYQPGPIIRDLLILITYGILLNYFLHKLKHRAVRVGIGIFTAIIILIAGVDARINFIANYYSPYKFSMEENQTGALFNPENDIAPIVRIYDEETEQRINGSIFVVPVKTGKSYMGYRDFSYHGFGEFDRFVPDDFFEYQTLWGVAEPMKINYFTWQYPGCDLFIIDYTNKRRHYFELDSRYLSIHSIRFFFDDLFHREPVHRLPLYEYAALMKYAFKSPYYTTDHIDDPYFLIEKGEYEKAGERMADIEDPAIKKFLDRKLSNAQEAETI